ncbi:hypothetical protein IQ63_43770 [Streptomyces acidiscabies]|uniref:Uncharacterized protein n=1 Tax=Streptomyces acidiscabies TaxID=42234 RepID=A0A0L0JEQ4_9ACTN|nr:hypothetical protein IQ63_43770 [Streptomyces acidiscabies]
MRRVEADRDEVLQGLGAQRDSGGRAQVGAGAEDLVGDDLPVSASTISRIEETTRLPGRPRGRSRWTTKSSAPATRRLVASIGSLSGPWTA